MTNTTMQRAGLKMDSYLGWKVDFTTPPGAPAFLAPDSVHWRVFKNPVALLVGGVTAVLLEFADARIRSGVWDHSTYKADPMGRSQRTGMAAMIGVYGPRAAAERVIQGVTNMHARVEGATPSGERYRALDVELLDWVAATASYGFLTAYDRFVTPLTADDKLRFYQEATPISRLYGAQHSPASDAEFIAMMERLRPRFEPHPIVHEFLGIVANTPGALSLPLFVRRAMACASVSLLPDWLRSLLQLGPEYDLSPMSRTLVRSMGAIGERVPIAGAPPAQACLRLGLPANFLYRSREAQGRVLRDWRRPAEPAPAR
ncbi:MAG: oxygenase MpaB family protein [Hyphomonadaceae bacterium]